MMVSRRIASMSVLALTFLLSAAPSVWAHDTAIDGIRILYRRHDVVVTVTTALSRLQKAEAWKGEDAGAVGALDGAIRRRLKLQCDRKALRWPRATVIADRAGDLVCWQTVIASPAHTVEAVGPLYPEDSASRTVVTLLRDGRPVEQIMLIATPSGLSRNRSDTQPPQGLREAFTQSNATRRLTPALALVGIGTAFLFGALHALSPGHGKTMVAAALVGTRGTVRHAVLLGAVVTLTHTVGVFALGLITLFAAQQAVPERLYPLLSAVSGGTIACVGATLLAKQIRRRRSERCLREAYDDEGEGYACPPPTSEGKFGLRTLLMLGVSGGAVPCPSALIVMMSAIALHRIVFGLVLILAFSLGLAVVLTGIGLMVVRLVAVSERLSWNAGLLAQIPLVGAATILVTGIVFLVRAFQGGGF